MVAIGSVILTLAMAWPVVQQPNDLLFGTEIVGRHADAYTVIRGFAERQPLGGSTQPVVDWLGVGLASLIGAVAAYNLLILISFPLAALAVFWLARYLKLGKWPAAWAAFLFAFSPLHIAHVAYHPHVAQVQWIPLVILAVIAAVDRWSLLRATMMLAVVALACLSNFYTGLILLVVLPVVVWVLKRYPVGSGEGWRKTVWTLWLIALVGSLYVGFFHGTVFRDPAALAFPTADGQKYAAQPWSYLVPPVDHAVLGKIGQTFWQRTTEPETLDDALLEQQVYLGWVALTLAVLGAWIWRKQPGASAMRAAPVLIAMGVIAFLFSLAPVWSVWVLQLPGPSWLLRAMAPMFRAYARFGFVVQLAIFLLAGLTWTRWRLQGGRWAKVPAIVLVCISVLEYLPLPPLRSHPLRPHAGYRLLAEAEPGWSVLDCILRPQLRSSVAPVVDGTMYVADGDTLDCGEPGLASKLASMGVGYVVENLERRLEDRPEFRLLNEADGVGIYGVEAEPVPIHIRRWAGFSWREGAGESSIRWAGGQASWWLSNPRWIPGPVEIEVELVAFPDPRELTVKLNGEVIETFLISNQRSWFVLRFTPHRARNHLNFIASGDAIVADQILGNSDRRRLAFGVGGVRYRSAD